MLQIISFIAGVLVLSRFIFDFDILSLKPFVFNLIGQVLLAITVFVNFNLGNFLFFIVEIILAIRLLRNEIRDIRDFRNKFDNDKQIPFDF